MKKLYAEKGYLNAEVRPALLLPDDKPEINILKNQELVRNIVFNISENKKTKINKIDLINNGLVQKNDLVKILSRGEINVKVDITANAFSNNAKLAIEKAGGSTNLEK